MSLSCRGRNPRGPRRDCRYLQLHAARHEALTHRLADSSAHSLPSFSPQREARPVVKTHDRVPTSGSGSSSVQNEARDFPGFQEFSRVQIRVRVCVALCFPGRGSGFSQLLPRRNTPCCSLGNIQTLFTIISSHLMFTDKCSPLSPPSSTRQGRNSPEIKQSRSISQSEIKNLGRS